MIGADEGRFRQQRLNLIPEPQEQVSFRPSCGVTRVGSFCEINLSTVLGRAFAEVGGGVSARTETKALKRISARRLRRAS